MKKVLKDAKERYYKNANKRELKKGQLLYKKW